MLSQTGKIGCVPISFLKIFHCQAQALFKIHGRLKLKDLFDLCDISAGTEDVARADGQKFWLNVFADYLV